MAFCLFFRHYKKPHFQFATMRSDLFKSFNLPFFSKFVPHQPTIFVKLLKNDYLCTCK